MLVGLTWLVFFQLLGELAVSALGLPLSGPVAGMLLLFAALVVRGHIPEDLRSTGTAVLQYLTLVLVPATAGIINHFARIYDEWLPILLAAAAGAAVTMSVTALTLRLLLSRAGGSAQ